jgi:hypothetical protein
MRECLRSISLLLAGWAATAANGQSLIENETLLFAPPKDFKVGFQSNHDRQLMTEWIPDGETVDEWTQMLTVQVYRGSTIDAATFLKALGTRYSAACPGTTAQGIYTGDANGYVVSMLLLRCPKNPGTGKPETTAFRVIRGQDALYSVQRAWRKVPSDEDVRVVMQALGRVTVCDTRTPVHPCPSFDSLVPSR